MTFDYSRIRALRDSVRADIASMAKIERSLAAILEQETATATVKTGKKRKQLWFPCPLECGKKHRKNDPHMANTTLETKAA